MPVTKSRLPSIQSHFESLTDPRTRKVTYPLMTFVVIAICGVIYGADDFVAITRFAKVKRSWLGKLVDLSKGIPSHDRFSAIFAAIKPARQPLPDSVTIRRWSSAFNPMQKGR